METKNCIFCQIVDKKMPAHVIWEDETHLAFLSIFPNTKGFTVVIPKKHCESYAFAQSDQVLTSLIIATKKVANILDNYFEDVGRTGMFFEGYGVDHLHSKLFPMHGTGDMKKWANIESDETDQFFELYPGYLCSNSSHRAADEQLINLAREIRKSYQD
ncbi:MAG: HIT family protein [Candidatus Pacebacteria bacterium]|jgi:histidine triad (HIT) family protein|nr:HIT family protein [Candidatus Paceibacterota bacterium]MBT4005156.1 HIT family protein [Candidatus Paceibacterota bacterium]MBT4358613.1 HIT family protein [Candidatus Paceibacterota bacterium]MBT4680753.1 HIT family protein [Candidatus Paceibacterota bacterium]MBT6899240.1 HIT family protein [Candidatus Paceibacterota bacterium]